MWKKRANSHLHFFLLPSQTLNTQALKRYQITSCESPAIFNFIKPCAYININFLGAGSFWDNKVENGNSAPGRQYGAIHSTEQRHAYEKDFETDYAEYRILHARVGAASQKFMELGAEIKRVQRGTPEYKVRTGHRLAFQLYWL